MVAANGDGVGYVMPRAAGTLARRLATCALYPRVTPAAVLFLKSRLCMH